jgi:hypothetical protein
MNSINRTLLLPRRNPIVLTRIARFIGKYRMHRHFTISFWGWDAVQKAWRASR